MADKQQKKSLSFEELITRADVADKSQKFLISCNYYFTLLSRYYDTLSKNKDQFNKVVNNFIFGLILVQDCPQKDRLLNYAIQNDSLNIFEYKVVLNKLMNYELVYMKDISELMKNCPETYKKYNFQRAWFEHNLIAWSKVFKNLSIEAAEKFLQMKDEDIKSYTFKMIVDKKINAVIDEMKNYIYFIEEEETTLKFDQQIQNFCLKTKQLADYINNQK